jgi:ubiquinone/menaquinone biosynthesis C-methylase UbiE
MFLRKTKAREPLPITMTGIRMGERLLQVGIDEPAVAGMIAAKVGMSGTAAIAVATPDDEAKARAAAAQAGALVDVSVTPFDTLPYDDGAFDVVVVHGQRRAIGPGAADIGPDALRQCWRVLRQGGRIVVVTQGPKTGLAALFGSGTPATTEDAVVPVLTTAGFRPVRVVGELEGLRFTEGLKS